MSTTQTIHSRTQARQRKLFPFLSELGILSHRIAERLTEPSFDHPVLTHELRSRMRGARAYWILLAYLGILMGSLGLILLLFTPSTDRIVGPGVFAGITTVQAILIALIAPALSCGAISLEKEHQTYEMLAMSRMNAWSLVSGKLIASLGLMLLCLLTSLPVVLAIASLGGLGPSQVLSSYALLALEAGICGAVGLFWSTVFRSTIAATAVTFPTVIAACLATLPLGVAAVGFTSDGRPMAWTLTQTPAAGIGVLGSLSPFAAGFMGSQEVPFFGLTIPFWVPGLLVGPLLILLLCSLAAGQLPLMAPPRRRSTLPIATIVLGLLALFLTGGLTAWLFTPAPGLTFDCTGPLWLSILFVLAVATPFVIAPAGFEGGLRGLKSARASLLTAVGWCLLCSGIALAGLFAGVYASRIPYQTLPIGPSIGVMVSFLALEISLCLCLARVTPQRTVCLLASLILSVGIILLALNVSRSAFDGAGWQNAFLRPYVFTWPINPEAPSVFRLPVTPSQIYAAGAALLFLLSMIPSRRAGAAPKG